MKIAFSIKEFLIARPKTVDVDIADKLFWFHIIPMIPVRNEIGVSVTASANSGYRPKWWELSKKRSGNSQHTFKDKGAVDWTCRNFEQNKDEFLKLIIEHTNYSRICIYNSFLHCDFASKDKDRYIFKSGSDSKWEFIKKI